MKKLCMTLAMFVAVGLATSIPAFADTAMTVTGGSLDYHSNSNDLGGWVFSTTGTIWITDLGILDEGLNSSHFVGIYDMNGTLMVGMNVTDGAGEASIGHLFTYDALTAPYSLAAGNYFIGEWYPGSRTDPFLLQTAAPSMATGITYVRGALYTAVSNPNQNQYPANPYLLDPATWGAAPAFYGPNFKFERTAPVSTPEPISLALLGIGTAGLLITRRKRG